MNTNYIKKKWKEALNIGRINDQHYLEVQRNALMNALGIISIFISLFVTIIYSFLDFSNKYSALVILPISILILICNKKKKYNLARNIAFFGCLLCVTFWCFYTRRSGAELLYITLACSCASIYRKKRGIILSMIACSALYFIYVFYDYLVPFVADSTINYFVIKTILAYTSAGIIFFQIMLYVEMTMKFSKSLDKRYEELNFVFDKQKDTEIKLQKSNNELVAFNTKLDILVKNANEEVNSYQSAINDNLYSIVTDSNGVILKINDIYLEKTGYKKEEVLGQNINILKSDYHSNSFYENINKTLTSGNVWRGESKIKTKSGNSFWIVSSILPILNPDSSITKYLTVSADITDKKNAEEKERSAIEKLIKNENRLQFLLENQIDLIVITDKSGIRKYVNQSFCNFFGKDKNYYVGTNYKTLDPENVIESYVKTFESLSYNNPKITTLDVLDNANGETKWIEWNEVAFFDSEKNITEILSIGHDVSELKQMEFQNANYIAQFEEMAFKNSHKFRGPLSNIIGITNLFDDNSLKNDEIKEFANLIKISADNLDAASQEMSLFINMYHSDKNHQKDKPNIDVDFDDARSKHLNWKYKIRNFLDGTGSLTSKQAISHINCDTGKWYYSQGKVKYGHIESMQKFELEHKKIHNQVIEILNLKSIDENELAENKYKELLQTSDKIILLLDEAEAIVKKSIS